jgi:succinate dehydrogenase / fumarate reductase flavoprotein subunit
MGDPGHDGWPTAVHPVVGLYAAGECACVSVHGANRLGTNSLLDASLFGRRAGVAMAEAILGGGDLAPVAGNPLGDTEARLRGLFEAPGTESVAELAEALKTTMTEDCGVFRDGDGLERARQTTDGLRLRFRQAKVRDRSRRFNTDLLDALETGHLLDFSEVIVAGALARSESRGAHFRTDFPKRDDQAWLQHTRPSARRENCRAWRYRRSARLGTLSAPREEVLIEPVSDPTARSETSHGKVHR